MRNGYLIACGVFCWGMAAFPVAAVGQEDPLAERVRALEERLAAMEAPEAPRALNAYWRDGVRLETTDRHFQARMGGRLMIDGAAFSADDSVEEALREPDAPEGKAFEDGAEIRRARLYMRGVLYDAVEYKLQYDFAGGEAEPKDVFLGLRDLPVIGRVRVGHQFEPYDRLHGSSKFYTLMEKAVSSTFGPGRNIGVRVQNTLLEKRVAWFAGLFRDTDPLGRSRDSGSANYSVRVTGLPWYEDEGRRLIHLGVAYSYRRPAGDTVRYKARPESHLAPVVVDTGAIDADHTSVFGGEFAAVLGPFSLQSEYLHSTVDALSGGNLDFDGFYAQASFVLTGEHRTYHRDFASFSRVRPKENFTGGRDGGLGAWEVAARYSTVDLNDGDVTGGELGDLTLGLNWYLNPNTRVMFNYVLADLEDSGDVRIAQTRFQVNF